MTIKTVKAVVKFHHGDEYLTATGHYTPALPGNIWGPPERCYPDEPSEFDIESVVDEEGNKVPVTAAIEAAAPRSADLGYHAEEEY